MLRWVKTEPGSTSRIVVSGTRESEQPNQRIEGDWPLERAEKSSGFSLVRRSHQDLLRSRTSDRASVKSGRG